MSDERWLPVVGYEGAYEVSDHGRVRSLDRRVRGSHGSSRLIKGRVLQPWPLADTDHLRVELCGGEGRLKRKAVLVHRLVLEAFVGKCPDGLEGCHFDDDADNNVVSNLYWGTRSENMHDKVRNGKHHLARRDKCKNGHAFTPENTARGSRGQRRCRVCHRDARRRWRQRKVAV